ncbi:ferredoxin [Streptomyces sp. DSM 42041]|uniref:Ferredoxin n=1 Tax=Streptomyces hazeniae TaxID=3075538 RepID=A0ABU2P1W3_9ACTN|nr:ferredoxin [Streptomyces sp. DSM 42041]MDT0382187.1 ferredoxin [Streptomyces sp. DSM 42041]
MRVRVDPERCCASGMCVLTAPGVFDQSEEDGSVRLLRAVPRAEEEQAVRDAVRLCPTGAIGFAGSPTAPRRG